mmetsp:Transcript_26457/g.58253  ORF Transcript_26457/g.58253 Transcript_26457/m.58253 type:complete len:634 (+) Transcript_26457:102-2003(+)
MPPLRRNKNSQGDVARNADDQVVLAEDPAFQDPDIINPQPLRQAVRYHDLGMVHMDQQIGSYVSTDDPSCSIGGIFAKESPDCKRQSDAGNSRPMSTISTAASPLPQNSGYAESPNMTSPGLGDRRLHSVSNSPELIKEGPEDTHPPPQWPMRNSFQQRPPHDGSGGVARTPSRDHEIASQCASPAQWNQEEPETVGKNKKVFVGGVPQDVGSVELSEVFREYGPVKKAWTQKCHSSSSGDGRSSQQQHRGFGFVIFESSDSVERLLGDKKSHYVRLTSGKRVEVKHALSSNKLENRQPQNGRMKPKAKGDTRAQDDFGGREAAAASAMDRERNRPNGYPAQAFPGAGGLLSMACDAHGAPNQVSMNALCGDSAAGPPVGHMMSAGQPQYHHMQPAQPQQGYVLVAHGDGSQLSQCNSGHANMPIPQPCASLQDGRAAWMHQQGAPHHQSTAQPPQHAMMVSAAMQAPQPQRQALAPQQQQQRMQQAASQPSFQQCAGRYQPQTYQTAPMYPVPYPQAMCSAQGMMHMHQQVPVAYPHQQQQPQQSLQSAMGQPQPFQMGGIPIQHHNQQQHMQPCGQENVMLDCQRSVQTHQPDAAAGNMHLGQPSQAVAVTNPAGMIEVLSNGQAQAGPRQ